MSINPNDDKNKKPYNRKDAIDAAIANAPAENKGIGGHARDLGLTALSGAVSAPELAVGLADIPTGGRVGKFLENEGGALGFRPRETKEAIAGWKTERSQEQMQEFTNTEGFGGKVGYALSNPSLITNTVVESLPSMLAGGVAGRGLSLAAKGLSPVAAGALGEGAVGAGLAAEQIRQQTDDGLLTGKQAGLAAATGATTAGFGFAGGKIAQKLGIGDVDTLLASQAGNRAVNGNKGFVKRVAGGAFSEGLLEELPQSVSETILQNEALGRPLDEGVSDAAALGLLSGAAMGGAVGGITRNRAPTSDDITPTEDMGQEAPRLGLPNPNRPGGNQLGYQGAVSDPNNPNGIEDGNPDYFNRGQGPDASGMRNLNPDPEIAYNSELGGQFSATQDGTVFSEAEYNDYLAQQQAQARADRDAGTPDINDVTQVPEGYEQSGSDPRLPAPRSNFEVTPDGTARTSADSNTVMQNQRAANVERLASRLRGDIQDNTPVPNEATGFGDVEPVDNRKLSERMGLDPSKGGLSAAAAIAVDSGASPAAAAFEQASAPSQSAWQQSMNQRLQMADQASPEYQSLAQAMANEPTSVPAKNKMLRDAEKLPSRQVDSKVVDPKARVINESRARTKAYTPKGDEVQAQWDVVDASQLVTSNTDSFTPNPDFPSERQPRDRTRAGSQKQVNDIANKLQPNMLGASSDISTGSPFIGANDNVVDSGNGRTMAIRRAYQEGSEKSKEYRQFVNESAGKYGLDVNAVNNMQAPVLVRRNMSNMDRNQFSSEANQTAVARMSSTEQAATDAKQLPDASLLSFGSDGAMNLYQSSSYIKNFISGLPSTEQSSMMDDGGALSQEGKRRVESAIIQDAYDAPNLVTAISETLGEGSKNILKVVTDKAPQISQINSSIKTGDAYESTLSKDIADAAQAYMDISKSGEDVESYLSKDALFDDGLSNDARDILKSFYDNRRSAKAMGENIQQRINAVTGKGNPKQGGLTFDDEQTSEAETKTSEATQVSSENASPEVQNLPTTTPEVTTNDNSKTSGADTNNNETEVTAEQQLKSYAQVQTEVADEMGITTNEDGEYDISDAQFDTMEGRVRERMEAQDNQTEPQSPVAKPETAAASPIKPPQSPVVKTETAPETKKPATKKADKPKSNTPKFSRASTKGSTNTTRQQVINKLSSKFGKETVSKLIAAGKLDIKVLSDFVRNGRLTIPSDVDGLYLNGKATLIADNLSDDMIIPTFLHELGGHGGMQTLMDKKAYDALMKDFDSLVAAGDPLAVQAKAIADKVARNKQEALDEYLPYLITLASRQQVKQGKVAGMINRMVMAIRSWLKNTLGVPIKINSQDILSLAERMVNEVEKQNLAFDTMTAMPQFSDPKKPDIRFSDPNVPEKQLDDVRSKYEGTDQWMKAPNGKSTNLTKQQWLQVRTPAFKEWFGDWEGDADNASQVVDDNGEPMVVYHGSPTGGDFNIFTPSDDYNAVFFTENKDFASKYTKLNGIGSDKVKGNEKLFEVFLNAKNYFDYDNESHVKEVIDTIFQTNETFEINDSERLILDGDKTMYDREVIELGFSPGKRNNNWDFIENEFVQDAIREAGFDGFAVTEGQRNIAVYQPNQIKSATDNAGTFDSSNPDIRFSDPNVPEKQLDDVRSKYEGTDQWLKTPNGKKSNLNKQQWLQVRTKSFKDWFGDWEGSPETASKVVDGNGEPMVVYHGSPESGFSSFGGGQNDSIHFTNDKGLAAQYSGTTDKAVIDDESESAGNYATFLNIKNPVDADWNGAEWNEAPDFYYTTRDGVTTIEQIDDIDAFEASNPEVDTTNARIGSVDSLASEAESEGYDGVIAKDLTSMGRYPDAGEPDSATTEFIIFNSEQIKSATSNAGTFDGSNPDIRFSRAGGMDDQFDPRNIAKESMTRLYDWASSAPPGKLSWWHKTLGTMYNLSQRNPYFKPVFQSTEKFINDVSFYAAKASEFAPRLLPQLDSLRDIGKSAIGAKDNEALSNPIFEGTLLWGRDLDGKAVLIEDWRKKTMAASKQDRLQMLKDANRITPAQLQELATMNNIQANRFINGIIDEEVSAGLVWTDNELRSKFDLTDEQVGLYREFRAATDNSLDSLTRSDMLRRLGKDANDIERSVMEAGTLREAVLTIDQHINSLIADAPKKEKSLRNTLKDIKESQGRTNKLIDDGYAPLSRFGQYTVDVVDSDGNREYFGMFESAYDARKMEAEMKELYTGDGYTVSRGALSNEEFKLFAGVTPETAELFGEMLGLDATGDKAADDAFQEYLRRTKNNRSAMKRMMHRKGIKGYSEDVGRVLASFIYSNSRHTSAALNMGNLDRSISEIPKGEGQLKDAAVKLAQYIKNPQEEGQLIRGWMFAQYLGGSIASAVVNITQPLAVSFPYLSQYGGAVKAASQLRKSSADWTKALIDKNRDHFEADLLEAIERAEADGTLSPQEVHNLLRQASGKNPLSAGDGTKVGDAKALASNTLSRVSLAWGSLFSAAEQVNRRITFVAAYRMAKEQGMDNPAEFATNSIKETQFVYNKASRMNWGRGAVGGTLMTFKTYTVSYMELMHRLWTQGEKGSEERNQGRKAVGIMLGTLFLLGGAGGLPFMEDTEDLVDGIGQIMGYNFSSKKVRQDFLDEWVGEMMGDFLDGGVSSMSGSPTDVSGRLGLGNLIPGTGVFKERNNNTRDVLELLGPAGDFVARVGSGTRSIAKGAVGLDSNELKKGALEFAPVAVRNAVKGAGMATSGIYKDTRGYKVADVSPIDAAFKFVGFQPRDISKIQEANWLGQSATSYYNLRASNISALWAAGVNEGNQTKVNDAKAAVKDWNEKNPNQKIIIKPNNIARRVREMRMDKADRVVKRAPKSARGVLSQDLAKASS